MNYKDDELNNTNTSVKFLNVNKKFGNFYANKDVSFVVKNGTIHAFVGENGAGKSTTMNLLFGIHSPTSGDIFVNNKCYKKMNPVMSVSLGIGMVHQHFMLSENETALDNAILTIKSISQKSTFGCSYFLPLDRLKTLAELQRVSAEFGMAIDFTKKVSDLSLGEQQKLEIIKQLYLRTNILILDEPTAVLSPLEGEELYRTLRKFCLAGKTVLLITHKLKEVLKHADYVTVMRRGSVVANLENKNLSYQELSEHMIGVKISSNVRKRHLFEKKVDEVESFPSKVVLELKNISVKKLGVDKLSGISVGVSSGEVVGIAGVEGNGQSELTAFLANPSLLHSQLILSRDPKLEVLGISALNFSATEMRKLPIGIVPEDRLSQAIVGDFTLQENLYLGLQFRGKFFSRGISQKKYQDSFALEKLEEFDVRPAQPSALCESLSGGNQQKLVMARELSFEPKLLIISHPTRGVDIGATDQIHERIVTCANGGSGVLVVSSELDELLSLCDRILVMFNGKIMGEFSVPKELTVEQWDEFCLELGKCMGGYEALSTASNRSKGGLL